MHTEGPATRHLETGFLVFLVSFSKLNLRRFLRSQVASHAALPIYILSKLTPLFESPITFPNYAFCNQPKSNFRGPYFKPSTLHHFHHFCALSHYAYKKDEWAEPGNLLRSRRTFSPQMKVSLAQKATVIEHSVNFVISLSPRTSPHHSLHIPRKEMEFDNCNLAKSRREK